MLQIVRIHYVKNGCGARSGVFYDTLCCDDNQPHPVKLALLQCTCMKLQSFLAHMLDNNYHRASIGETKTSSLNKASHISRKNVGEEKWQNEKLAIFLNTHADSQYVSN